MHREIKHCCRAKQLANNTRLLLPRNVALAAGSEHTQAGSNTSSFFSLRSLASLLSAVTPIGTHERKVSQQTQGSGDRASGHTAIRRGQRSVGGPRSTLERHALRAWSAC